MKSRLGEMESQFFAYTQMRDITKVRSGDLEGPLGLTGDQERRLLSRLAKAGIIVRVQRGLYLLPPRLPLGGAWDPGEALALTTLMEAQNARYQVCGPNAFNRYGFDEQIPLRTYVYNTGISGDRKVGKVALTLIKVAEQRLGDTEEFSTQGGQVLVYSSRVRTLVDAVYDWSRFNSLPRGYDWICQELSSGRISPERLVDSAARFGDVGTKRRIGFLLDREGVGQTLLQRLQAGLKETSSPIPWIPTKPKIGKADSRWGVVDNASA